MNISMLRSSITFLQKCDTGTDAHHFWGCTCWSHERDKIMINDLPSRKSTGHWGQVCMLVRCEHRRISQSQFCTFHVPQPEIHQTKKILSYGYSYSHSSGYLKKNKFGETLFFVIINSCKLHTVNFKKNIENISLLTYRLILLEIIVC